MTPNHLVASSWVSSSPVEWYSYLHLPFLITPQLLDPAPYSPNSAPRTARELFPPSNWIELLNSGQSLIDLSNHTLTDESFFPDKWRFPSGTRIIPAGLRLILMDDRESTATYVHSPIRLKNVLMSFLMAFVLSWRIFVSLAHHL